jgi:hypothetical protein
MSGALPAELLGISCIAPPAVTATTRAGIDSMELSHIQRAPVAEPVATPVVFRCCYRMRRIQASRETCSCSCSSRSDGAARAA